MSCRKISSEDALGLLDGRGRVLYALYPKQELYASQIAERAQLSQTHLCRILPRMENEGLVKSRESHRADRRFGKYYSLDKRGYELAAPLFAYVELI